MSELNPNHPVTQEARDLWHKIAAALLYRLGGETIELEVEDFAAIDGKVIVLHAHQKTMTLSLVTNAEAEAMVKAHGGKAH